MRNILIAIAIMFTFGCTNQSPMNPHACTLVDLSPSARPENPWGLYACEIPESTTLGQIDSWCAEWARIAPDNYNIDTDWWGWYFKRYDEEDSSVDDALDNIRSAAVFNNASYFWTRNYGRELCILSEATFGRPLCVRISDFADLRNNLGEGSSGITHVICEYGVDADWFIR